MNSQVKLEDDPTAVFEIGESYITNHKVKPLLEQGEIEKSANKIKRSTPLKEREYLVLYMRADPTYHIYKRWTESLMTLFGDLGGILGIVMTSGFIIVSPFVQHSMNSQLINEVYQVQQYSKESTDLMKAPNKSQSAEVLTPRTSKI